MVQPADGDGEAGADFAPHSTLLRELDVVGVRRGAAADQAWLSGHKPQMIAIAFADGLADRSDFLRVTLALPRPAFCLPLLRR